MEFECLAAADWYITFQIQFFFFFLSFLRFILEVHIEEG